jgi:hypothetical protein
MIKKILFITLTILLGLVFIFSGLTKLYPVELFELTLIDLKVSNWVTAPIISRLMIATEFFLGALLILNFNLRKFTLKATIAMLVVFTIYLTIQIAVEGNNGNCKCFGNVLIMSPLESIIKNLVMLGVAVVLFIWHKGFVLPFKKLIMIVVLLASLSMPFILNPPDFIMAYQSRPETVGYKMNLDTLYNSTDIQKPVVELRNGKHIIAFMSLTCRHCRIGAYKMHIIKKQRPEVSMYLVLNGDKSKLEPFFADTKANNIPYIMLLGERFTNLAGYVMPAIFLVNNSVVEQKLNYIELDIDKIDKWLKNK